MARRDCVRRVLVCAPTEAGRGRGPGRARMDSGVPCGGGAGDGACVRACVRAAAGCGGGVWAAGGAEQVYHVECAITAGPAAEVEAETEA